MIEENTAYSIDGHLFHFTSSIDPALEVGGYVNLDRDGEASFLGQILDIDMLDARAGTMRIAGRGEIRAVTDGTEIIDEKPAPFGAARLVPADPKLVLSHFGKLRGKKAGLEIGKMRRVSGGAPATLQAAGFGRHTLVCGQSGSGKTYSLGVILERLLLETNLRIAVLDPNSDYVRLGELADAGRLGMDPTAHAELSGRYGAAVNGLSVHGTRPGQKPLRSRFGRLPLAQQALVLDLDPIRDARQYNVFRRIIREIGSTEYTLGDVRQRAIAMFDEGARDLAIRIENLDVEDLGIWAPTGEPAMIDLVPKDWRALVLDLGSLPSAGERSMMAASAVAHFWQARHDRQPTLLVIDEAHNVCPQTPADRFQAMAAEELAAIAGEGRKFGLYLLLVTQRPQKIHVNVLSQCENLLLMRMNSTNDIDHLATVFSHVPSTLIRQASTFGLGEGLAAGLIAADPMMFQTGTRYAVEGGGDIPATWAEHGGS
jgi:DNA helicase HerA-like ATPase